MTTQHPDGVTLSEYVDDGLAPAAQAGVATHVASCAECRATVEAFLGLTSAARALPPIDAPRGAWPHIERELRPYRAHRRAVWPWLAAAAALILATFIGFKIAAPRRLPAAPAGSAAEVEANLANAEQFYQKALVGLEQIANDGKGALDPQTASTLEKNLTVIDQAISESRAALRAQPTSEPAQASLLESFKSKITLLSDTVALINEMRKGVGAGDGRAVSGFKQKGT
jgi:hypothetical protein